MSTDSAGQDSRSAGPSPEDLLTALTARGGPLLAGLPAPRPAEGIELLGAMSGSGHRSAPGLVRRADGQTLQLTTLLYGLLELVDGRRTYADIAAALSDRVGRDVAATDVCFLAEAKLRPLGVLQSPEGGRPATAQANPLLGLRCKVVVSDPERTRRITSPFSRLFHPLMVAAIVVAFTLITGWLVLDKGMASAASQALYSPELLLLVFGLTIVSAGFHEFGHAAACRYGGATPGVMGAGLYLVWPAFYTDVSDSYRLGRGGRMRVDLGGLYFNAIFAVGTFGLWSVLRWDALLLVIGTQILQMARQLTPLVRFDGYHILADLTGVPDLFAHIKPTLLGLLPSRWGRAEHRVLKPWARAVVTGWVLSVVPILAGLLVLMVRVLPRLAITAWDSFGVHWEQLAANWMAQDLARVGVGILALIALTLPVASVTYLLVRIGKRVARWVWRASAGSPLKRTAAVVGAVLVIAGIGWLWAADGGTPIDGTEGGTLFDAFAALLPPDEGGDGPDEVVAHQDPWAANRQQTAPGNRTVAVAAASATPTVVSASADTGLEDPEGGRTAHTDADLSPPADRTVADDGDAPDPEAGADPDAGAPSDSTEPVRSDPRPPAPRHSTEPVRSDSGPPTPSGEAGHSSHPRDPWPFPFDPPGPVASGGNRAYAVNTTDGRVAQDVALSLVRVSGGPVHHRNEAWALAQCRDCKTVAVAFQVVLLETDDIRVVAPVNHSVAYNDDCERCVTHGLAVQLVVTLTDAPSPSVLGQIQAVMGGLEQLRGKAALLPLEQVHADLVGAKADVLGILAREAPDADVTEESQLDEDLLEEEAPSEADAAGDAVDGADPDALGSADPDADGDVDGDALGTADPDADPGADGDVDGDAVGSADPDADGGADGDTEGEVDGPPLVEDDAAAPDALPEGADPTPGDDQAAGDGGESPDAGESPTGEAFTDDEATDAPTDEWTYESGDEDPPATESDVDPDPASPEPEPGPATQDVATVHEDDGDLADAGKPPVDAADEEPSPDPDEDATT